MSNHRNVEGETSPASANDGSCQLHTSMYLNPAAGSARAVTSPAPFMINGVKVWSSTPIHIYNASDGRGVAIEPAEPLGQDFVDGWHKLPDELKTRVLAFNLCHKSSISYNSSVNRYDITRFSHNLRCIPEIAGLARDIYYTRNTFKIREDSYPVHGTPPVRGNALYKAYPQRALSSMIRSITYNIRSLYMNQTHVRRLANGDCGFEDLRRIEITVELFEGFRFDEAESFAEAGERNPIRFGCNGLIIFKVSNNSRAARSKEQEVASLRVQARLEKVFVLGCNKDKRGVRARAEDEDAA